MPPEVIVRYAHGGTTVTSELIMTAPGLLGPFETGFLLANRPAAFINTKPFAEWTQGTGAGSLGLAGPHFRELLRQRTHLDMYSYALREAPMFSGTNTTRFVDKTPAYWGKARAYSAKSPGRARRLRLQDARHRAPVLGPETARGRGVLQRDVETRRG